MLTPQASNMSPLYDVIVIGGSAAGLSATLSIARTLNKVLCIDAGKPCNRYANESHNFITHDNENPLHIRQTARDQIEKYPTAEIIDNEVVSITKQDEKFVVSTDNSSYDGKNIILAVGLDDNIKTSGIENLGQFWGNSIFTCGYCHGFEYAGKRAGLYVHNENALKPMIPIVHNWNDNLTVFGSTSGIEQFYTFDELKKKGITPVVDSPIVKINGEGTQIQSVTLENGKTIELDVLYYAPNSIVNMKEVIAKLGVEFDEMGFIKVDKANQQTNVPGIYAAGDCTTFVRSLAIATQTGQWAGANACHKLFTEKWINK